MKTNYTEVVFVLDRSGSMSDLVSDTIGGFNSFIERQKESGTKTYLTTILFDDKYEILHDRVDISKIDNMTAKDYFARGSTALLDSIGKAINHLTQKVSILKKKDKPSQIIFVITTDGFENSSKEFTTDVINKLVVEKTKEGWTFLFLGANIDSFSIASTLGISATHTSNYSANSIGTRSVYDGVTKAANSVTKSGFLDSSWKEEIQ